jgi:hypothetical protein
MNQESKNGASLRGQPLLLGEEVVEGFYGGEFVVFDVEDGVELGDVEDVLNFLGEAEEFEFAAGVADSGEAADQFADAGGVDVIDVGEVENNFFLAGGDEFADGVAKVSGFVAESDASVMSTMVTWLTSRVVIWSCKSGLRYSELNQSTTDARRQGLPPPFGALRGCRSIRVGKLNFSFAQDDGVG